MTHKEFWLTAYLGLLNNNEPEEAVAKADQALALCNARWEAPDMEMAIRLVSDKPVGAPDYRKARNIDVSVIDG